MTARLRPLVLLAALALGGVALAASSEGFYLETPPASARGDLTALQQLAESKGWESRVVRRYELGEGWTWVVVVEGFEDESDARAAADLLADQGGRGVAVYRREGRTGVRLTADGGPDGPGAKDELPEATEVLAKAARAVGGLAGGEARLAESPALRFVYERELEVEGAPLVVRHELARDGERQRLQVEIVTGVGKPSLTVITESEAWLLADGVVTPRDRGRSVEVLSAMQPEQMLAYPLRFARLVEADPAHGLLRTVGAIEVDGERCWALEHTGPEAGGTLSVVVSAEDWRPAEVSYTNDAGVVRYRYRDWRELDTGLVVPFEAIMERDGEQIEALRVRELAIEQHLPDALFTQPSAPAEEAG
ncbi:MAG: hypothetical protein H6739_25435 [Alphaproteobacteria bacterium]|nr:hypothetical protein [Alphaproteobacteria bacterium]